MSLVVPRGRPGAVLALAVLCAHLLALQALLMVPAPGEAPAAAPGLRVLPVELAHAPGQVFTPAAVPAQRAAGSGRATAGTAKNAAHDPRTSTQEPVATHPGTNSPPARIAPPMRLRYAVTGHNRERPVTGQAELSWQHDGQRYEARLEMEGEGLVRRRQHSAGRLTAQGLAPERFAEHTRREEAVHFDREAGRAIFSANRPPATLQPDAQDRLSLLLQLGARIAARPGAYPAGAYLELQTSTTRDALIWRFRVEGSEELQLPAGHLTTLRLSRLPAGEFEPRPEVWLAPGLDYAPVRMRLTQHAGDHLDYQWSGTDRR